MKQSLPSMAIILALILPSLTAGAQTPDPGLQTPLAGPTETTAQALDQALGTADETLNPGLAAALAGLEAFQDELQACAGSVACLPTPELLTGPAIDLVTTGGSLALGQAAVLGDLGALWADAGEASAGAFGDFATGDALVPLDESGPNGQVVVIAPQGPQPGVAALAGGFYAFDIAALDTAGEAHALGDWRFDVLGLQVLPGSRGLALPGLASLEPPAAALTLLYTVTRDNPGDAVVAPEPCDAGPACFTLRVPAGPLKLERLYAGSQVFVRFSSGTDADPATFPSDVGFHNALVTAAVEAALDDGDLNALALLDGLDQFPTAVLLAPQVVDPASPDPDADGWITTIEAALNSDPLDQASVPGGDDDGDGVFNYLEASRAAAALPDDLNELGTDVRVPFAGRAFVHSALAPPAVRFVPGGLLQAEVADFGVAGPPSFTLDGLSIDNLGSLVARQGEELHHFALLLDGVAEPVAAWTFVDNTVGWQPDAGTFTLTCSPDCVNAEQWTLGGLGLPAEHALRFHLWATLEPRGANPEAYDGKTFLASLDPQSIVLTSELPLLQRGPVEQGVEHRVDVVRTMLRLAAQDPTAPLAGEPEFVAFSLVDDFGNRDLDADGDALTFALKGAGNAPSPRGNAQATFTASAAMADGLAEADATLVLAHAAATLCATHALFREVCSQPFAARVADPDRPVVETPSSAAAGVSADAAQLLVRVRVEDRFGNLHGAGVPVVFEVTDPALSVVETTVPTDAAGRAALTVPLSRVKDDRFLIQALAGGLASDLITATVTPGALASVVLLDQTDGEVVAFTRALVPAGADPLLTDKAFDGAWLRARAFDAHGNAKTGFQGFRWSGEGPLAGNVRFLHEDSVDPIMTSLVGGIVGKVCVEAREGQRTATDCADPVRITGRGPPTVAFDCAAEATPKTGNPFQVCATIADDVLLSTITAELEQGATVVPFALTRAAGTTYTGTVTVPGDSLANFTVAVTATDHEAGVVVNGIEVGGSTFEDALFTPIDDDVPVLGVELCGDRVGVLGGATPPFVRPDTSCLLVNATDNIGLRSLAGGFGADRSAFGSIVGRGASLELRATGREGLQTATGVARDTSDNFASASATVFVDGRGPAVRLLVRGVEVPDGTTFDAPFVVPSGSAVRLEATDLPAGGVGVRSVRVNNGTGETIADGDALPLLPLLRPGKVQVTYAATDRLGNDGPAREAWLDIDALPPVLTPVVPAPGGFVKALPQVRLRVTDNGNLTAENVTLRLDGAPLAFTVDATNPRELDVRAALGDVADGAHTLVAEATDAGGVRGGLDAPWTFVLDTRVPALTLTGPEALVPAGAVPLTFTATDANTVTTTCARGSPEAWVPCVTGHVFDLADGSHTLFARAVDAAGNEVVQSRAVVADGIAPVVQFDPLGAFQSVRTFSLRATAADAHLQSVQFEQLLGQTWTPLGPAVTDPLVLAGAIVLPYTATADQEGAPLTFRVRATDAVGHASLSATRTTTVDSAHPLARLDSLGLVRGDVVVTGQAGVPGQSIQGWTLDASSDGGTTFNRLASGTGVATGALATWKTRFGSDGPKVLRLTVNTLSAGNSTLIAATVDNTAPVISNLRGDAAHGASGAWSSAPRVTLQWDIAEAVTMSCRLSTGAVVPCTPAGVTFDAPNGGSTLAIDATDLAGNAAVRQNFPLQIDAVPPAVSALAAPATLKEGTTALVQVRASDAHSGLRSVSLVYTAAGVQRTATMTRAAGDLFTATIGPFGVGSVALNVVARDQVGREALLPAVGSQVIGITDATPPTVRIAKPTTSTLVGVAPVEAELVDAGGIASATARLVGTPLQPALVAAGTVHAATLDTTTLANGDYRLVVEATDAGGNVARTGMDVTVANPPTVTALAPVFSGNDLTLSFRVPGPPGLQVKLFYSVRGEVVPARDLARSGDVWSTTITGLAPGDLVNYFVEARDGAASARWPGDGLQRDVAVPIPEATALETWEESALASLGADNSGSEGHTYVEITTGQFTHNLVDATFAFQLNGFPTTTTNPVPRYLVEFDTDGDQDPELTLEATYSGDPAVASNWAGRGLDGAGAQPFTFAVQPDAAANALAFQVPVTTLAASLPDAGAATARFVAHGSLALTGFAAFDIAKPVPAPTAAVPATITDTQALPLDVQVTDNLGLANLTARVELTANGALTVLPATIAPVTGAVQVPDLPAALPPGTVDVVLTVLDQAGNKASLTLPTVQVLDLTAPALQGATLGGRALVPGQTLTFLSDEAQALAFGAELFDAVGLSKAELSVDGGTPLPLVDQNGLLTTSFGLLSAGDHTLRLTAADIAGNTLPAVVFKVQLLDRIAPVIGVTLLRRSVEPFDLLAPSLAALEAGDKATVSAVVTDNLDAIDQVTATVSRGGAVLCTLALARLAGDLFEAPLDSCPLGLGPLSVEVAARDASQNLAVTATPLALAVQDNVPPVLEFLDLPAGVNDAQAPQVTFRVRIVETGGLVQGARVLLVPDIPGFAPVQLNPAGLFPGEHVIRLGAREPGGYRVSIVAADREFDAVLGPVTREVVIERSLVVDDRLGPELTLAPGAPSPGAVTPAQTVTFAGTLLDAGGVDAGTVALRLDGVRAVVDAVSPGLVLTPLAEPGRSGFAYTYSTTLTKGRHEFSLSAADHAGNPLRSVGTWGFYVVDGPVFAIGTTTPAPQLPQAQVVPAPPAPQGQAQALVSSSAPAPPPPPVQAAVPALAEAGAQATIPLTGSATAVTGVAVTAEEAVTGARVVARELAASEVLPAPFETLFRQVEVVVEDAAGEVAPVVLDHIDFRVPRAFVQATGVAPDGAALLHAEADGWAARETALVDQDAEFFHYRALHGGRSTFAIVFDRAPPVVELIAPDLALLSGGLSLEAVAHDDTAVRDLTVTLQGSTIGSGGPVLRLFIDPSTLAQILNNSLELVAIAKDATGKTAQVLKIVGLDRGTAAEACLDPGTDQAAPITTVSWQGGDAAVFGDILGVKGPVAAVFSVRDQGPDDCTDATVPEVRYRVDDGPLLGGLRVELRADAPHTLEYFAVDSKGNEEAHRVIRVVPAEGADTGELPPAEALVKPQSKTPGFEVGLLAAAALLAGLVRRRRSP